MLRVNGFVQALQATSAVYTSTNQDRKVAIVRFAQQLSEGCGAVGTVMIGTVTASLPSCTCTGSKVHTCLAEHVELCISSHAHESTVVSYAKYLATGSQAASWYVSIEVSGRRLISPPAVEVFPDQMTCNRRKHRLHWSHLLEDHQEGSPCSYSTAVFWQQLPMCAVDWHTVRHEQDHHRMMCPCQLVALAADSKSSRSSIPEHPALVFNILQPAVAAAGAAKQLPLLISALKNR